MLGRHAGLIHFTVGQRRGLDIGGMKEPLYVIRLEPETRRVVAGPKAALAVSSAELADINWLGEQQRDGLTVKVRSMARPAPARFDGAMSISPRRNMECRRARAAVLYDGDRLLGGGWIEETVAAELEVA